MTTLGLPCHTGLTEAKAQLLICSISCCFVIVDQLFQSAYGNLLCLPNVDLQRPACVSIYAIALSLMASSSARLNTALLLLQFTPIKAVLQDGEDGHEKVEIAPTNEIHSPSACSQKRIGSNVMNTCQQSSAQD